MILKDSTGAQAEIPIRLFDNTTGAAITGRVWVTGDVKIYLPDGGAWVNATVANIVEKGRGYYALRLAASETDQTGKVYLDLDTTAVPAASAHSFEDDVVDVVGAFMAYSHDTGATVKGLFRRLDALVAGKATGLRGTLARYFMRDGTTVAIDAPQDVATGARSTATITGSES